MHDVMLCLPNVRLSDGTILRGAVGDVVRGVQWAEARAAAEQGLVVIVDDFDADVRAVLRETAD